MKLIYNSDYLSIKKFEPVHLPSLTVLTGLNGSGKSHLLDAIINDKARIEGINRNQIVFFNSSTFYLDSEQSFNQASILAERQSINMMFQGELRTKIEQVKHQKLGDSYEDILKIAKDSNKPFLALSDTDLKPELRSKYNEYKFGVISAFERIKDNHDQNIISSARRVLMNFTKCSSTITLSDIENLYTPINHKNQFLLAQLGKIFSNYYERLEKNDYDAFLKKEKGKNVNVFGDSEFVEKFGGKPWELLNDLITRFSSLDYVVNFPKDFERGVTFQLKLISKSNSDLAIDLNSLSSGEKTMMALVASMYKAKIDTEFPRLLLLDEIDSSLHPSMTKNLYEVLDDIFVKEKGMSVIMVTHSPSTVALAPPDSIYLMKKSGLDRIVKTTNEQALNILTEGFASLTTKESSLRLNYVLKKSSMPVILTEGITDRIILEAAWQKLYNIPMPFEIQDFFDANSLRTLLSREELFKNYPSRKFIAVFDFDQGGYDNWAGLNKASFDIIQNDPKLGLTKKHKAKNGYAILLPVPDNPIQAQVLKADGSTFENESHLPIELFFHDIESLKDNFVEVNKVGGGKIVEFRGSKSDFAEQVAILSNESFKNFEPLFSTIKSILL
jgi:ABC-type branched-subunit amino acid transport system ATPase component